MSKEPTRRQWADEDDEDEVCTRKDNFALSLCMLAVLLNDTDDADLFLSCGCFVLFLFS